MKKDQFLNPIFITGIILIFASLFLIFKNMSLTGFVISDLVTSRKSYFLPLILFIGGILMASSADGLQSWLEKAEAKNPSRSLEGKLQTKEEKRHFSQRYSGKPNFISHILRKKYIEAVGQKDEKYSGGANYQQEEYPSWKFKADSDLTPQEIKERAERERIEKAYFKKEDEYKEAEKEIKEIRNRMIANKKSMGESPDLGTLHQYMNQALELKKLYDKFEMPFPAKEHMKIPLKKQRETFIHGGYLERSSPDFSNIGGMNELAKQQGIENESTLSEKEAYETYIRDAKTASVRDVLEKYPVRIIHTIPLGNNIGQRGSGTYELDRDIIKTSRGVEPKKWEQPIFDDFLNIISSGKGIISASAESRKADLSNGGAHWGNSYIGAIIKDGRIYSAGTGDAGSLTNKYGLRRGYNSFGTIKESTDKTMKEILRNSEEQFKREKASGFTVPQRINEVFVGDYTLEGFYVPKIDQPYFRNTKYDPVGQKRFPEPELRDKIRKVANMAIKKGLKLYVIDREKGSTEEVDPVKYRNSLYVRPSLLKRYEKYKEDREASEYKKAA